MKLEYADGRLWRGDCLELMQEIPSGSIDMILCDLPYGTTQNKWDAVIPFEPLWREYWRIVKTNGAIVLTASQPFSSALVMSQPDHFKYEWVWEKDQATGHLNAKKQPMRAHESILVFYQKQCIYNPVMVDGAPIVMVKNQANASSNYGSQTKVTYNSDKRYPRTVQRIGKDSKNSNIHPTQKPVALFEYLIKTYTNPGEIVLDNTSGSGTTAIAARNTNRRWVCIEQDETYFDKSRERIEAHTVLDI